MRNSHSLWTAAALGLAACLGTSPAHVARPTITDDARIVDAKSCQLEAVGQVQEGQHGVLGPAVPAISRAIWSYRWARHARGRTAAAGPRMW